MPRLLALCLLLCPLLTCGQIYFNERYPVTPVFSGGTDVLPVTDGYWLAGQCNNPFSTGARALFLQHVDSAGGTTQPAKLWAKRSTSYYTGGIGSGSLWQTRDGGMVVSGSLATPTGRAFGKLWRFTAQGDTLWSRTYSAAFDLIFYGSCLTTDGGFALTGIVDSALNSSRQDVLLVRTDSLGRELWRQTYHVRRTDMGHYVRPTRDGGFLISGFTTHWFGNGPAGQPYDSDGLVIKVDSLGSQQWITTFGGPYVDAAGPVLATNDTGYVVSGTWTDSLFANESMKRPTLLWLDSSGQVMQRRSYGRGQYGSGLFALHPLADGGFIAAGQLGNRNAVFRGLVLRVCADGDLVWYRTYRKLTGGQSQNYLRDLKPTSDGGFVAAGFLHVRPPDIGTPDAWLFKMDQHGYLQPGGPSPAVTCRPTGMEPAPEDAVSLYPNPSPTGRFTLRLPSPAHLTVTDALGRQIMHTQTYEPETQLDLSRQSSGLYVLRVLWPDGRTLTRKLLR